ncbi:septal ring lytic transglycosylase RlpA family protein [Adhaeribacter aquaticus]|uniref:septal ring lytic transglycosylase RlpA family protein n=1 Tax=Adhaeribacter aquaticus TaxID=299567 RepID=UPI0003FE8C67|nr:septal ring lytic transglycosylase RlpA family protein [Adhaeribacter aquaticus]
MRFSSSCFNSIFFLLILIVLNGCAGNKAFTEFGKASYYSNKLQGRKMANGNPYRKGKRTAAHKTLPFGTKLRVTNQQNGKSVKVRVTDRGPFVKGRVVDLSLHAAKRIDMVQTGVVPVKIKVLNGRRPN